jgi:hypothetical protein
MRHQHQDQQCGRAPLNDEMSYIEVQRDWTGAQADKNGRASKLPSTKANEETEVQGYALGRWREECMREQPYHVIGSVSGNTSGQS